MNITISGWRWFSIGSLFSFLLRSCTRGNIIGKWDRDGIPDNLYSFSIYKDSTFFINVHEKPSKNHIPGWHVGNQLQRNKEAERAAYQYQLKQYGLLTGLGIFLLIAFLLYRNNRQQSKANRKLQLQKEEIQRTLSQLKSTQKQLIQSEKMASLGELTAGIAHEIQNPLDFVNNFSEVNNELLVEMKDEMKMGKIDDATGSLLLYAWLATAICVSCHPVLVDICLRGRQYSCGYLAFR